MTKKQNENVIAEYQLTPNNGWQNVNENKVFMNVPFDFGFNKASQVLNQKPNDVNGIAVARPDNVNVVSTISHDRHQALLNLTISNNEQLLINTYRRISNNVIIEFALTEIVNASFVSNEPDKLVLDIGFYENEILDVLPKRLKQKVKEAFYFTYRLYNFSKTCKTYFKDWYVDGKIAFEMVMDHSPKNKGLIQLNRIDTDRIARYEVYPHTNNQTGEYRLSDVQVAYIYRQLNMPTSQYNAYNTGERGRFIGGLNKGDVVELNSNLVVYVDSGEFNHVLRRNVGFLHKCLNALYRYTLMEQSMIIFRITRAPSRLVIYVDVENASEENAKRRLAEVKNDMRGSRSYDVHADDQMSNIDNARQISPTEDIYITRNANGKTTEITQLDGGKFEGILDETEYFLHQLKLMTKVPLSRWTEESNTSFFSNVDEKMTREEERFGVYVSNLVTRFVQGLFEAPMRAFLLQNNYIDADEWDLIKSCIYFKPTESNNDIQRKKLNDIRLRADVAQNLLPSLDVNIYSRSKIAKDVFDIDYEEFREMQIENIEYIAEMGEVLAELGYGGLTVPPKTTDPVELSQLAKPDGEESNDDDDPDKEDVTMSLKKDGAIPAINLTKIGNVAKTEKPKKSKDYKNHQEYKDYKSDAHVKI